MNGWFADQLLARTTMAHQTSHCETVFGLPFTKNCSHLMDFDSIEPGFDRRVVCCESARLILVIDFDDSQPIRAFGIEHRPVDEGDSLVGPIFPVSRMLFHDVSLFFRHILCKGWPGRNELEHEMFLC